MPEEQANDELNLAQRIERLEAEIERITQRNKRVELDKGWETSRFRIVSILVLTYLLTTIVFWLIGVERYLLSALIPTIGYLLSTTTLPILRAYWIKRQG